MILDYPLNLSKIKLNFTLDIPAQLNYYFEMKGKKQMKIKKVRKSFVTSDGVTIYGFSNAEEFNEALKKWEEKNERKEKTND